MIKPTLLLLAALAPSIVSALTLSISTGPSSSWLTDSLGTPLDDGMLVQIGTYIGGFDEANFVLFDTTQTATFPPIPGLGHAGRLESGDFFNADDTLFDGQQVYIRAFNASSVELATEWGFFTSSNENWFFSEMLPNVIALEDVDQVLSAGAQIIGSEVRLGAMIPEPATAGFLAGAAMLGLVALRRRQA